MDRDELLKRVKSALAEAFGPRLRGVVLYGSQARGDAGPDSDIDLLVVLEEASKDFTDEHRCTEAAYPIVLETGQMIDFKVANPSQYLTSRYPLYRSVRREGVLVSSYGPPLTFDPSSSGPTSGVQEMSPVTDFWKRAKTSLGTAKKVLTFDPDTAASKAYYAAFYAVTAYFEISEKAFVKHTAIRAAVHRELVHTGLWTEELGQAYDDLLDLRIIGDYGAEKHVEPPAAERAIEMAEKILAAVSRLAPQQLPND